MKLHLSHFGDLFEATFKRDGERLTINSNDKSLEARLVLARDPQFILDVGGRLLTGYALKRNGRTFVSFEGRTWQFDEATPGTRSTGAAGTGDLSVVSPMPGTVIKVHVSIGDRVVRGQSLAIVEAMKMENEVRSPGDALVRNILVAPGRQVGFGETLLELVPPEEAVG
ncbi:MAG: acetyl-CoA carboxylase biotin carboxyl carrier protein subunit [Calditrichaeota bacterium]|nr:acetyl-CoA carboxylase biotin carboxyl carrier protein subunit [Calditrichota bacterium]